MAQLRAITVECTDGSQPHIEVRIKTALGTSTVSARVSTFDLRGDAQAELATKLLDAVTAACGRV